MHKIIAGGLPANLQQADHSRLSCGFSHSKELKIRIYSWMRLLIYHKQSSLSNKEQELVSETGTVSGNGVHSCIQFGPVTRIFLPTAGNHITVLEREEKGTGQKKW